MLLPLFSLHLELKCLIAPMFIVTSILSAKKTEKWDENNSGLVYSLMINIIKIGEIPNKLLQDLIPRLLKRYGTLVEGCQIGASLELPTAAYDPHRMQYRAEIVLERVLHRMGGEDKVLALTDVDLYVPRLNFVFGQAQCPGTVALISLRRLDPTLYGGPPDYELLLRRATKETIHELGHTFGLNHCSSPRCVMTFSNSIFEVDEKKAEFCERCLNKLHARRP